MKILPFIIIAFVLLAAGRLWMFLIERKRQKEFADVADTFGLGFVANGVADVIDELDMFDFFKRMRSTRCFNLLIGDYREVQLLVFDLESTPSGSVSNAVTGRTMLALSSYKLNLPRFALRTETFLDKVGMSKENDIDFENFSEFSGRYVLTASDESAVRNIFSRELIRFFERHWMVSMEAEGDRFLFYRDTDRLPPEELQFFVREGLELYRILSGGDRRNDKVENDTTAPMKKDVGNG